MDGEDVGEDERRLEVDSRISELMEKWKEKARCTSTYTSWSGNTGEPEWQTQEALPWLLWKGLVWATAL
jgi:hypothetical protein